MTEILTPNGPLYKTAHFGTAYLNVPPNMHRLRNAVGLTLGLWSGRKIMDIVAGETLAGEKVHLRDVPYPLRPLYRLMPYDHFSDNPADRWHKVFDMMAVGALGGLGAALGSVSFYPEFMGAVESKMGSSAAAFTIGDAERRALYTLSKPWALTSAVAAIFGSASGFGLFPSLVNYSLTLGTTFTMRAERAGIVKWMPKEWRAALLNTHGLAPLRPTKEMNDAISKFVQNEYKMTKDVETGMDSVLHTWFRDIKPAQVTAFKEHVIKQRDAYIAEAQKKNQTPAEINEGLKKLFTGNYNAYSAEIEKRMIEAGIDPREARFGDMGFLTKIACWVGDSIGMGTTRKWKEGQALAVKGIEERHKALLAANNLTNPVIPNLSESTTAAKVAAGTILGTTAAAGIAIAMAKDSTIADLDDGDPKTPRAKPFADDAPEKHDNVGKLKHRVHAKRNRGFVNGHMLDMAEGVTSGLNAAIGMHRVHCAVGLTIGSWFGDKIMEAITGVNFSGKAVTEAELLGPLKKIYKILPLTPGSDLPTQKWLQALRWGVPGLIGGLAVMQGSKMFFEERSDKLKKAKFLDEVEDQATMAQSQPWSYTSAISSLMGFPTGAPMLPIVNYSTNLGTRFSMASGRKVALPILGKIWSNNSTLFPFGPNGMIDMLIREAVNNKSYDPELLETYTIGVLKPWYDKVTPQQIEAFVTKVHEVRDKYLTTGGVPEDMKKQLEQELNEHFHKAGLHTTLKEIGLDPLTAQIANNGLSGSIANVLGAGSSVNKIKADFAKTHAERVQERRYEPNATPTLSA